LEFEAGADGFLSSTIFTHRDLRSSMIDQEHLPIRDPNRFSASSSLPSFRSFHSDRGLFGNHAKPWTAERQGRSCDDGNIASPMFLAMLRVHVVYVQAIGTGLSTYCLEVAPLSLSPSSYPLSLPSCFSHIRHSEHVNNELPSKHGITKRLTNGVCYFIIDSIISLSHHFLDKLNTSSSRKIKQLQPRLPLPPKPHYTSKLHSRHQHTRTLKRDKGPRETITLIQTSRSCHARRPQRTFFQRTAMAARHGH
jgi:hypothetical protein